MQFDSGLSTVNAASLVFQSPLSIMANSWRSATSIQQFSFLNSTKVHEYCRQASWGASEFSQLFIKEAPTCLNSFSTQHINYASDTCECVRSLLSLETGKSGWKLQVWDETINPFKHFWNYGKPLCCIKVLFLVFASLAWIKSLWIGNGNYWPVFCRGKGKVGSSIFSLTEAKYI